jgi:uncharacterized damage-inducible protein DinB
MPSKSESLIREYVEGPQQLRRAVAGLNGSQLIARPVAGMWSILEVVCHLADSEQAWCHRMKRVIAEERPLLIGYDESRFAASLVYQESELAHELDLIESMRVQMARVLRAIPESTWERQGVHSERGLMSLSEMVRAEVEHIPHHIRFIVAKRRALGSPAPE